MSFSGFQIDSYSTLVIDASVVINLTATGCAARIIQALPGSLVVTESVFGELIRGGHDGHSDGEELRALIDDGAVHLVKLGDIGNNIYLSLVEGSVLRTLDDGEAATIGYACETTSVAVIDERKARRLCAKVFPNLSIATTVDLLTHHEVHRALGEKELANAVAKALRVARMRVPPHQRDMIIELVGEDVASLCHSLPKAVRSAL